MQALSGGQGGKFEDLPSRAVPAGGETLSIADVRVKPGIVLEGKPVEFGFALPVRVA